VRAIGVKAIDTFEVRPGVYITELAPGEAPRPWKRKPLLTRAQLERLNGGPLPLAVCVAPAIDPAVPFAATPEEAQAIRGGSLEYWRSFFDTWVSPSPVMVIPMPVVVAPQRDPWEPWNEAIAESEREIRSLIFGKGER
jgi:hypothetical protein